MHQHVSEPVSVSVSVVNRFKDDSNFGKVVEDVHMKSNTIFILNIY